MARGGFFSVDSLKGVHVLVVDGDQEGRDLLTAILQYCGALVTAAGSLDEALTFLKLIRADAIVVDLDSPRPHGLDLIRRLRGLKPEDGGVVPALAVGGRSARDVREQALGSGFDAYLAKPLDPWELCRAISTLVTTS
jgi:CheY-like chemotaxis protein